eukprot:jgi/Hompol1/5291/HPOL_001253-RA
MTLTIDILIFDGADELDIVGPLEALRNAQANGSPFNPRLVSIGSTAAITCSHGLSFAADKVFVVGEADILVVPGGRWASRHPVGVWGLCKAPQPGGVLDVLKAVASLEKPPIIASVCTGAMLLAYAGIIKPTSRATTHHVAWNDLLETVPGVTLVKKRVVDDGNLMTAGGVTSGIDLALHLTARFDSLQASKQVAIGLEYGVDSELYNSE